MMINYKSAFNKLNKSRRVTTRAGRASRNNVRRHSLSACPRSVLSIQGSETAVSRINPTTTSWSWERIYLIVVRYYATLVLLFKWYCGIVFFSSSSQESRPGLYIQVCAVSYLRKFPICCLSRCRLL